MEAGCHPALCASFFPVLFPLKSLATFHLGFLSNPGFPVPSLTEVHLSTCALSQSCVPPSSGSTSLLLISSQLWFHKYPAASCSFYMPLIHASPFGPFYSLLTESVDSFSQGTGFSSKNQSKVSPPPEACSCLYTAPCHFPCCSVQALVVLGWKLKQVLKQPHKEFLFNASIFHGVLHNMSSERSACGRWCPRKWKLHSHFHH